MFASRLIRSASIPSIKESTLLAGLAVHPNARAELISLYHRVLHNTARLPDASEYKRSVNAITNHRLAIVEANVAVKDIEAKIDNGQIEELIKQAEDEISLVGKVAEWEAWKPLEVKAPEGQWKSALV
ncbi:UNVERIFIED_CONTAM: hypothetical protein HDU68_003574 [Siphonaria sp. JEL0065]|nr:hypothetical protein HDU68_003574 [Siphonaria sp. JEL0065]